METDIDNVKTLEDIKKLVSSKPKNSGWAEAFKNIRRMLMAHKSLGKSRQWLDSISGYDSGDMSLRLKQYENLLIIEICILVRELPAIDEKP